MDSLHVECGSIFIVHVIITLVEMFSQKTFPYDRQEEEFILKMVKINRTVLKT